MARYRDFSFELGDYGKAMEHEDASAIVLAIRNILLTRKGNFPFTPSFGMDIEKYMFDVADEQTAFEVKTELSEQIAKYIPSLSNVFVDVSIVKDQTGKGLLGIAISSDLGSTTVQTNFLLYEEDDILKIVNETR